MRRCAWVKKDDCLEKSYHDNEWGRPIHNDQSLFELFCLESYQSGVSWNTVLHKRKAFNRVFKNYDIDKVASMTNQELELLLRDESIIRHRGKLFATRNNAQKFLMIQEKFGSFDCFIWSFVSYQTIDNGINNYQNTPSRTFLSERVALILKKYGFKYVGPTMIYSFMQAAGLVNDHEVNCDFNPKYFIKK